MYIILFVVITYIIVGIISWIVTIYVCGFAKNDNLICEAIVTNLGKDGYKVDKFNDDVLIIGKMPSISKLPFPIFGLYYNIENIGVIPFWYKSHKLIKEIYKDSKRKHNSEENLRRRLNI